MHIVLLILKIVGIIFLSVLGLVLCLLLAVLFVPLRYRLKASREPQKGFSAEFHISWLLHLLRVNGVFNGKEFALTVRLAMFTLMKTGADEPVREIEDQKDAECSVHENRDKVAVPSVNENRKEEPDSSLRENKIEQADVSADEKTYAKPVRVSKTSKTSEKIPAAKKKAKADTKAKRSVFIKKWSERIKNMFLLLCSLPQKIVELLTMVVELLSGLPETQSGIFDRIERLKKTIRPYMTTRMKHLYTVILSWLVKLIRHYKPRKMDGYIQFGTGMADLTGKLTGAMYLLLPANACRYEIDPVFNEAVFYTDTVLKGHIRFCHAAVFGIKCLLNKDFRRLLRLIRRGREE